MVDVERVQVVVLHCPYDNWDDPATRDLFAKLIALKKRGYLAEYRYGILPFDTYDFIATHFAICERTETGLEPVMAFKTTDLARCRFHNVEFPALAVTRSSGAAQHEPAIGELISRCDRQGINVGYDSSWTIDPEVRANKPYLRFIMQLSFAILVSLHMDPDLALPESLLCGSVRLRTADSFGRLGYVPLSSLGQPLPPFRQASIFGDEALMLHASSFNADALENAVKYRVFWANRLEIGHAASHERAEAPPLKKAA